MFLTIELRAKKLPRTLKKRKFTSVLDDRTSFRTKELPRTLANRNYTAVFDDPTSFPAKELPRAADT